MESLRRDILRFLGPAPPPPPPPLQPPPPATNSVSSASAIAVYPFTGGAAAATARHRSAATTSRHSSVERDVVGGVDTESPAATAATRTCGNCGAGSGYPVGISGTPAAVAVDQLDAIKREIAIGLRAEIRELVREVALVATGSSGRNAVMAAAATATASPVSVVGTAIGGSRSAPPRMSTPSQALGADLYQTHLYTQL